MGCYGYLGEDDSRLPDEHDVHVCYRCLLHGTDKPLLNQLRDLAQKRWGVHVALEKGLTTKKDFSATMGKFSIFIEFLPCLMMRTGMPLRAASSVYDHLRINGYTVPAKTALNTASRTASKFSLHLVRSGPIYEKMMKDLFDPMMLIGHLVSNCSIVSHCPPLLTSVAV